jgi:hypothetical protein
VSFSASVCRAGETSGCRVRTGLLVVAGHGTPGASLRVSIWLQLSVMVMFRRTSFTVLANAQRSMPSSQRALSRKLSSMLFGGHEP